MVKLIIYRSLYLIALFGVLINQSGCEHKEIDSGPYLEAARRFADTVVEQGRDRYGEQHTPLFVDGLQIDSLAPATWKGKHGETWVLSNFSSQQPLMRLLDGLSALTGDDEYRLAAEKAAGYVLANCRTPNGLLYWGGHCAWDLILDNNFGEYKSPIHEVKSFQPYFRLLWRVDPTAARKLLETIWGGHILDWSRIDYNRHSFTTKASAPQWDHEYLHDIEVPWPTDGANLSFCNVSPTLLHSGYTLALLGNDDNALTWSRRLVLRWQQARHPKTGLCGGQLSYRQRDRAQIALGHVHPDINEARIVASYHQTSRYHKLPLSQLQAAEYLREAGGKYAIMGEELVDWASGDLKTYAEYCYDATEGVFVALMTDGTPIKGQESNVGYYEPKSFAPKNPDGFLLWGYAMAYRLTGDESHWAMLNSICGNLGLGDIGNPDGTNRTLTLETEHAEWQTIYALLEMYKATHDKEVLELACLVANNLLAWQTDNGLFPRPGRNFARTGDEVPLALLHLAAVIEGKSELMPKPMHDNAFFHATYHGELEPHARPLEQGEGNTRTYDWRVYYGPR
jgi:pectate lyase